MRTAPSAEPEPGTQRMIAICSHCGEGVEGTYGRRAGRYNTWTHVGSPGSIARPPGHEACDPRFVADYRAEKARGLR